ncbi:MAG: YbaB/EbfC family nucleoid-associated protein [Thermoanaerobaculaceae bacterium]|nr:YbaB/EbfC family nucleoid-associated protein [Thermoanaerobaculaceae bacterium]
MANLNKLLKEAQKMQEKIQEEIKTLEVEASSGGGMVTVKMSGEKKVLSLKIDPSIISQDDKEMLEDLVVAAVNEASMRVDEAIESKVGGLTRGLGLPGF